ncbi:MAG: transcriptional regulator [Pelagibacterium sp. SCN 63-23]|jgi:transcriptional regulator with XRE-family HTH domain|nr:MAG: transcriptional regulator [Pelagibacterium sp. SCN 63-23]
MEQTFGTRIKALRTEAKLTLDQLAKLSNSSKSYIWELENKNPPRPSAEKMAEIAKALRVTTDYLLGNEDETVAEDKAFFRKYSKMSEETRRQIRAIADTLNAMPSKDDD